MERIYPQGKWITSIVTNLTYDQMVQDIYRQILFRTIGVAADDINFPYDRYSAPDGIGRPEKAKVIGQWLCTEARIDPGVLCDPAMLSFLFTSELDDIWRHAQSRLAQTGFSKMLPTLPHDEEVILDYDDGFKLVAIIHPEAIRNEHNSSGMSGAVGQNLSTFVLRDKDNESVAMLVVRDNVIVAMHGPRGKRVPYHVTQTYLLPLIEEHGYALSEPTVIHGSVMTSDGLIHDLRDIPDGSTIDGDFWIRSEGNLISKLPSDLTVNGDFGLFDCIYITETPNNLTVSGNCGFSNCPGLSVITYGMNVGGWSHFETCHRLNRIEGNVDFGEGVLFSSEISTLSAEPFRVQEIAIQGGGVSARIVGSDIVSDEYGRAVIDGDFLRKAIKRQRNTDIAQLPSLATQIAYDAIKSNIIRGFRSLTKNKGDQNKTDSSNHAPRM